MIPLQMLVPDDYVFPGSWGYTRRWLVLHKTGGGSTAQGVAQWFQSGAGGAKTSVHYVVGLDGTVVQCVREQDGAGGNCCLEAGHDPFWPNTINLNLLTFSIESVDPTLDNLTPMPQVQKDALFPLIKDLCTRQHIPMRPADSTGGIAGHQSIAPQSRAHCPGNFPWDELWAYLKGTPFMLTIQAAGGYFEELDSDIWRSRQTSYILGHGILQFYRSFGGQALFGLTYLGLPLMNEVEVQGVPGATMQRFERGVVIWDPDHKIDTPPGTGPAYMAHLDTGIGMDPRYADALNQIKVLQAQLAQTTNIQLNEYVARLKQINMLSNLT